MEDLFYPYKSQASFIRTTAEAAAAAPLFLTIIISSLSVAAAEDRF